MTGADLPHPTASRPIRPSASAPARIALRELDTASAETGDGLAILLPITKGVGELSWNAPDGMASKSAFRFGDAAFAGPALNYALSGGVRCLVVHVPKEDVTELGGGPVRGVFVCDLAELANDDLVLWETAARLRCLASEGVSSTRRYMDALAEVFVTHALCARARTLTAAPPPRGLSPRQLRAALDFITANLKEPLTTAAIAQQAHLSEFHFMRLFKASTGLAPRRYLVRARVLRARELLLAGDCRVAEAAYAVGFCDQSHLDRHFRRHFGYPPKNLLKLRRAQE